MLKLAPIVSLGGHIWVRNDENGMLRAIDSDRLFLENYTEQQKQLYYDFIDNHRAILGKPQYEITNLLTLPIEHIDENTEMNVVDVYLDKRVAFSKYNGSMKITAPQIEEDEDFAGYLFASMSYCNDYLYP